jgi:AbrB family looped-hinge helix DNA binding protein
MQVEFGTVTSKGQVVIPAELRRKLRIKAGTRVAFREQQGQLIVQPITDEFIDSLRGMISNADELIRQRQRDHLEDK